MMKQDSDLIELLPPFEITSGLISHYFEYVTWMHRHVNSASFLSAWSKFQAGDIKDGSERMILSTSACIIAMAINYLPQAVNWSIGLQGEELKGWDHLAGVTFNSDKDFESLGEQFFEVSTAALQRHQDAVTGEGRVRGYTLELIELLCVRTHYLSLAKQDSEVIWAKTGELVIIGMAMGLHRDPRVNVTTAVQEIALLSRAGREREKAKVEKMILSSERRRWAWWHIIVLER